MNKSYDTLALSGAPGTMAESNTREATIVTDALELRNQPAATSTSAEAGASAVSDHALELLAAS